MAPEVFSEEINRRQFQPAAAKVVLPFRQNRNPTKETFEKLSLKLREMDLPGIEFAEKYLYHLYSRNRRPNTLELNCTSIRFFLEFLNTKGIDCIEAISRKDVEAFIEHEQDRGMKPMTVRGRLGLIKAFLRYLIEEGVVRHEVLSKRISVKVPDALPKAIAPEDVKALLAMIDNTRNRALVLMLLRTGMRIGELLGPQDSGHRSQRAEGVYPRGEKDGDGEGCLFQCRCQRRFGCLAGTKGPKRRCARLRQEI